MGPTQMRIGRAHIVRPGDSTIEIVEQAAMLVVLVDGVRSLVVLTQITAVFARLAGTVRLWPQPLLVRAVFARLRQSEQTTAALRCGARPDRILQFPVAVDWGTTMQMVMQPTALGIAQNVLEVGTTMSWDLSTRTNASFARMESMATILD